MTPGGVEDVLRARIDVQLIRIRFPTAQKLDFVFIESGFPCRCGGPAAKRVPSLMTSESEASQALAERIGDQVSYKRLIRIEQGA